MNYKRIKQVKRVASLVAWSLCCALVAECFALLAVTFWDFAPGYWLSRGAAVLAVYALCAPALMLVEDAAAAVRR